MSCVACGLQTAWVTLWGSRLSVQSPDKLDNCCQVPQIQLHCPVEYHAVAGTCLEVGSHPRWAAASVSVLGGLFMASPFAVDT